MEALRKTHNRIKLNHIKNHCSHGCKVLDVGCGRGGDMGKWKSVGAIVTAGDPDSSVIPEARRRAKINKLDARFFTGGIENAPMEKFDIICYNFSLQYCFENKRTFSRTMTEILKRMHSGSKFIGCIPDSEFISMNSSFEDSLGNAFVRCPKREWYFGDQIKVHLDSPYYGDKFIGEPVAHKDLFITWMEKHGCILEQWEPLCNAKTDMITDLYSKFCFYRV